MRIFVLLFYLAGLLSVSTASAQVRLTGRVVAPDGAFAAGANVILLNKKDSVFVMGAIAGDSGNFVLNAVEPGSYRLQVSQVGFLRVDSVITVYAYNQLTDLGTFILAIETAALNAVVIKAEKPLYQQKAEGLIVNVENNIMTKGSTALELLARSPGIVFDQRNNSITLNGKSGVTVLLNGKAIRMSVEQVAGFLSSISGNNVERIELLPTPPAGYDAEGGAGVINIVLKKNKLKGTTGSFTASGGYGKYEKATIGGIFQYANEKMNAYGSYTYSHNHTFSNMYLTSEQHMDFMGGDVYVSSFDTTKAYRKNHDAVAGIDIFLNKRVSIGFNSTYNHSNYSGNTITHAGYDVLPDSLLTYRGYANSNNRWNNFLHSVYLEQKLKGEQRLSINADYLHFNNTGVSAVQNNFIDKHGNKPGTNEALFGAQQRGTANTDIKVGVFKADYAAPLSKRWNVESGVKITYTRNRSMSGIESWVNEEWQTSEQTSNNIVMNEIIAAAYTSFKGNVSPSLQLTAGLRYEYWGTYTKATGGENAATRQPGRVFPSVLLTKSLNNQQEWQFSYTQRISRPSYNDLASYVGYSDPTAVYTGNPLLKPAITHNVKVGYQYRRYAVSLLYSRDVNAISRYQLVESPGKDMLLITPQNLPRQEYVTLQVAIPVRVNKWWSMHYNWVGGYRYSEVNHTRQTLAYSYLAYSFNFNQVFALPHGFSAELSGWYNTRSYDGSKRLAGFIMLNAGIKKQLHNNKGFIQLAVADILQQERYIIRYGTLTQEAFDIRSHVTVNAESVQRPIFRLTYSRSFGNGSKKQSGKSNVQEESGRVIRE